MRNFIPFIFLSYYQLSWAGLVFVRWFLVLGSLGWDWFHLVISLICARTQSEYSRTGADPHFVFINFYGYIVICALRWWHHRHGRRCCVLLLCVATPGRSICDGTALPDRQHHVLSRGWVSDLVLCGFCQVLSPEWSCIACAHGTSNCFNVRTMLSVLVLSGGWPRHRLLASLVRTSFAEFRFLGPVGLHGHGVSAPTKVCNCW